VPTPATPPVTNTANGSNKGTKVELQTSYLALIGGLLANYQPDDVFELPTGDMTRDQLITEFQGFVSSAETTKSGYQAWRADVQDERTAELKVRPLRAGVKGVLVGKLGRSSTLLLTYGFTPAKVAVKSVAVKTGAVAKSKATREARGTKGSVQKRAITGNVTGVIITPVTAGPTASQPAAATPAPAPAGSAASASNGASAPVASVTPPATGGTPGH
jgi:hypothetical protein